MTDANEVKKERRGDLPFAYNEVVRLMKNELDEDKMVRERVKVEMNKFLGDVLVKVCKQLNEYSYSTITYDMLKECLYPYESIDRINQERERIITHLEAIKRDCDILITDTEKVLRINENNDPASLPAQLLD